MSNITETQVIEFIKSVKDKALIDINKFLNEYYTDCDIPEKEFNERLVNDIFFKMNIHLRMFLLRKFAPEKEAVTKHAREIQGGKQYKKAFNFIAIHV